MFAMRLFEGLSKHTVLHKPAGNLNIGQLMRNFALRL